MSSKSSVIIGTTIMIILGLILYWPDGIYWQDFTNKDFQESIDSGKTVVVYFTSEDCFACQKNEQLFKESTKIQQTIRDKDIVMLYADIVDTEAWAALQYIGHDAVPVFALFNAKEGVTELVGELTEQQVLDVF